MKIKLQVIAVGVEGAEYRKDEKGIWDFDDVINDDYVPFYIYSPDLRKIIYDGNTGHESFNYALSMIEVGIKACEYDGVEYEHFVVFTKDGDGFGFFYDELFEKEWERAD